jgi:hypothetical protein
MFSGVISFENLNSFFFLSAHWTMNESDLTRDPPNNRERKLTSSSPYLFQLRDWLRGARFIARPSPAVG